MSASVPTCTINLYMAGDIDTARQTLRQECWTEGLCVTLTPTMFVYSGGAEDGFCVGFVNYPRFPTSPEAIWQRATAVAGSLIRECAQRTALLVGADRTEWLTRELGAA